MTGKKNKIEIQHKQTIIVSVLLLVAVFLAVLTPASPAAAASDNYPSICREYDKGGEMTLRLGETITLNRIEATGGTDHFEKLDLYLAKFEQFNSSLPPSNVNPIVLKYFAIYDDDFKRGYQTMHLQPYMWVPGVCLEGTYKWNWNWFIYEPVLKVTWSTAWVQK